MYLGEAITLQADSCHNLDPRQMICIRFQIHDLYLMYHSVVKVKKIVGLSFSKPSFKVPSVIMFQQAFTKGSDMPNKNALGVKRCKANKKQPYLRMCNQNL